MPKVVAIAVTTSGPGLFCEPKRSGMTAAVSPRRAVSLFLAVSLITLVSAQRNQGVRLAVSPLGSHTGRVEVKYNGTWGTICNRGWGRPDAIIICRMLNFTGYICDIGSGSNVFGQGSGRVFITDLRCSSQDQTLDECINGYPLSVDPCSHSRDAAVICQGPSAMPVPSNITELSRTTRSIRLGWQLRLIPPYIQNLRFELNLTNLDLGPRSKQTFSYSTALAIEFEYTFSRLVFNTSYLVSIRAEGGYQWCPNNRLVGNNSKEVTISTASSFPPSTLPMRLITLDQDVDFVGRLQVMHNGEWGYVCGDSFDDEEANVACWSLNYTRGAVSHTTRPFLETPGTILLDEVNCRDEERFEDCSNRGWGVHDCIAKEDSIILGCNPGSSVVPDVTGLRVTGVTIYSISLAWDPVPKVAKNWISFQEMGRDGYDDYVEAPTGTYTLQQLRLSSNYSIRVGAGIEAGGFYTRGYVYSKLSDPVYATPQERSPTAAVRVFDVSVLNNRAVKVTWSPPSTGLNGEIRGYKLFVNQSNGNQTVINIGPTARVYLVTDLEELSTYLFSILMYTVGDGPLSVWLQVTIPTASYPPLITKFGVYGDGIEDRTLNPGVWGVNVLCGSDVEGASFEWRYINGSRIGIADVFFKAGNFEDGTAVIQVGSPMLPTRRLTLCDGGVYTCVATAPDGRTVYKNLSLTIRSSQPQLDRPRLVKRGSTWIQIGWEPLDCDGGYPLRNYFVEYRAGTVYTSLGDTTSLNYTIRDLSPGTEYEFRVGRESTGDSDISYSEQAFFFTLDAGPSAPREVVVRVGFNSEVCVTWRPPANPIGTVILYKLYAEVEGSEEATDAVDLPANTPVKTFLGSVRSGCMKLEVTEIIYYFQMSAVAVINGANMEGTLSPYSELTTVFFPGHGMPQLVNVTGSTTNTSATLQWGYIRPVNAFFNVSYSGVVEWTSPAGVYTSFLEQGWKTTEDTSLTFSLLTPSTSYVFSVCIVTDDGQHGPELSLTLTTGRETGGKLAYFQVRIQNIDSDCIEWVAEDTEDKLSQIQESLQQSLFQLCQCRPQLSQAEFSCRTGPPDTVIYRARITGTASRSASEVVAILGAWVQANNGSVKIDHLRLYLDPTCDPTLENIHGPDCPVVEPPTETTTTMTDTPTNVTTEVTSTTTEATSTSETMPTTKTESTTAATESRTKPTTVKMDTSTEAPTTDNKTNGTKEKGVGDGSEGEDSSNGASSGDVVRIFFVAQFDGFLMALIIIAIIVIFWLRKSTTQLSKDQGTLLELESEPGSPNMGIMTQDDKL